MAFGIKTKELQGSRINHGLYSQCTARVQLWQHKTIAFLGIPLLRTYAAAKVRCANCGCLVKLSYASTEARTNATLLITPPPGVWVLAYWR